jgi:hypothetical protein
MDKLHISDIRCEISMAGEIQVLFTDPPIAIARLGASTRRLDCFLSLISLDLLDGHRRNIC